MNKGCAFLVFCAVGIILLLAIFMTLGEVIPRAVDAVEAKTGDTFYMLTAAAFVLAFMIVVLGGAVVFVRWLSGRAGLIHPARGGQFPLVKVGGRTWAGFVDPNRSPSSVTAFDRKTGAFAQPTPLSEAATVALAGQATAAAMVAGATRHPSTSRANMLTAVDAVMKPATLSKPLPPVEVFDDADHIDRLLLMAGETVEEET